MTITKTTIRGLNHAQRAGNSTIQMLRTGDIEMAALMAKVAASEVRLAVTRMVNDLAENMGESEFFGEMSIDFKRATACILVAEKIGWTRSEVEADAYRADQLEWNRAHGMILTAHGMEWIDRA